jgi:hypothetical protein
MAGSAPWGRDWDRLGSRRPIRVRASQLSPTNHSLDVRRRPTATLGLNAGRSMSAPPLLGGRMGVRWGPRLWSAGVGAADRSQRFGLRRWGLTMLTLTLRVTVAI